MSRSITIQCADHAPVEIQLTYSIETVQNVQTISCSVAEKQSPNWLQLRKFVLLSSKGKNGYTPLFNEINSSKNMDTSLFIDQVYTDIMLAEKLKISTSSAN